MLIIGAHDVALGVMPLVRRAPLVFILFPVIRAVRQGSVYLQVSFLFRVRYVRYLMAF